MFQNYMLVVDGGNFSEEKRRALLLICLGTEGNRIFASLPNTGTTMEDALRALEEQFQSRINTVAERYRFRCRAQRPGEPIETYTAELRDLVSRCEYKTLTDEMIRDQIVEKCNSKQIREKLLMEPDLTLTKALEIAGYHERACTDAELISGESFDVQAVDKGKWEPRRDKKSNIKKCYRCGAIDHLSFSEKCPARNVSCKNCKKQGHFSKMCLSRGRVSIVENLNENNGIEILHVNRKFVNNVKSSSLPIICTVCLSSAYSNTNSDKHKDKITVNLTVDTGSCVSILAEKHLKFLNILSWSKAPHKLSTFTKDEIPTCGFVLLRVDYKHKSITHGFYVTKFNTNILGRDLLSLLEIDIICGKTLNASQGQSVNSIEERRSDLLSRIVGFEHKV